MDIEIEETEHGPVMALYEPEQCPEINLTYERRCEGPAGHDGWHGFMWDWNDRSQGANRWPGPSLP